jgi:PPP family 3-phenylpropionic acid transporter
MNHLGDELHRYSGIRLWGSIGFILAVSGLGTLLGQSGIGILPVVLMGLFVLIWLSSLAVPESAAGYLPLDQEPLHQVLRKPLVLSLLAVCFLVQASHGPYYAFFSIYMEEYGYPTATIGQLWALGVVAEICIFLLMPVLLPRYGARRLLIAAVVLTTLRWLLTALYADRLAVIIFSQSLHAASFGLYHAVMIALIHSLFVGAHQGRGQALYSSISFGAGGAAGILVSGYLWTNMSPQTMYLMAALTSLCALLVVHFGVRNIPQG